VPPLEPPPALEHASTGETWRGRLEPTFADAPTEELPVRPVSAAAAADAPTLSSSEAPQSRRIERRKILSLRLAMAPQRIEGAKLQEALVAESLQHGKYGIFHRLHPDGSIVFSVASMVEPGAFELEKMGETLYPGVTMFTQLPGPVPGMHALNELIACARRLQANLGGTLQDERGVPLTVHRIERMRQEVREFERPQAGGGRGAGSQSAHL
jgi:cell division protein ZipA